MRDDESAGDRKFPNFTVTPGPSAPLHSSCFFPPPAPPRYFSSRSLRLSLRLSRSPPYSPPLSPTSGSSTRRSSPAAGGLPLSSPHRSAPRLLLPAVLLPLPFFSAPWPAAGEGRRGGPPLLHGLRREARRGLRGRRHEGRREPRRGWRRERRPDPRRGRRRELRLRRREARPLATSAAPCRDPVLFFHTIFFKKNNRRVFFLCTFFFFHLINFSLSKFFSQIFFHLTNLFFEIFSTYHFFT